MVLEHKGFFVAVTCMVTASLTGGCRTVTPEVYSMPIGQQQGGTAQRQAFRLGVDVLEQTGFKPLLGKRVGLITNQTSVNGRGVPTRLVLQRAPQVNLTALYVPEHGLDGKEKAGLKVRSRRDRVTGLTAHSLYGDTRKPTAAMLRGVDVLVFDLQDIGCRSYTYISTMVRAMEAAGEQGKEFLVLDRPNPLGGLRVEGPPLEKRWQSFVGQIPVPYVYGMTAGELAMMTVGKRWIKARPLLGVVKMRGWSRGMLWRDTRLRWVQTSPNIPKPVSPHYYVATGILGGVSGVDIGIRTDGPFEYAGAKGIDGRDLARTLRARGFPGVRFIPYESRVKAGFSGVRLDINPDTRADLVELDITLLAELNRRKGGALLRRTSKSKMNLFHKVYGSDSLARDLAKGYDPRQISADWRARNASFLHSRRPYLIYP